MPSVSLDDLRSFAVQQRSSAADDVDLTLALVDGILVTFLGADWVRHHVRERASSFLNPPDDEPNSGLRHHHRIITLAEALFAFQETEGIESVINQLQGGDIESACATLQGAHFLWTCGVSFTFRSPTGVRQQDYDLDARLLHAVVACEAKAKFEHTQLSDTTVGDSLASARKQLPTDRPTMILLRIPEAWPRHSDFTHAMKSAIDNAFRNTTRVSAVVTYWEAWSQLTATGASVSYRARHDANPRAARPLPHVDAALLPRRGRAWSSLIAIAQRVIGS